jgi:hypothetical protein
LFDLDSRNDSYRLQHSMANIQHLSDVFGVGAVAGLYIFICRDLSLYSKQRNAGQSQLNESTLFNHVHKHSFGGLEADTLTFCKWYPFPRFSVPLTCAKV